MITNVFCETTSTIGIAFICRLIWVTGKLLSMSDNGLIFPGYGNENY